MGGYLIGLSVEDVRKQKIPFWILAVAMAGSVVYGLHHVGLSALLLGAVPGLLLSGLAVLQPQMLGIGDGLLAIIYGMVYGWQRTCIWLMVGFLLTAVSGLFVCLFKRRKQLRIPFIPFLTVVHVGMCL